MDKLIATFEEDYIIETQNFSLDMLSAKDQTEIGEKVIITEIRCMKISNNNLL